MDTVTTFPVEALGFTNQHDKVQALKDMAAITPLLEKYRLRNHPLDFSWMVKLSNMLSHHRDKRAAKAAGFSVRFGRRHGRSG